MNAPVASPTLAPEIARLLEQYKADMASARDEAHAFELAVKLQEDLSRDTAGRLFLIIAPSYEQVKQQDEPDFYGLRKVVSETEDTIIGDLERACSEHNCTPEQTAFIIDRALTAFRNRLGELLAAHATGGRA